MRVTSSARLVALAIVISLLAPAGAALAESGAPQQAANLLKNPGFEGEYKGWDPIGNVKVAPGWTPWYIEGNPDEQRAGYGRVAEFYPATNEFEPGRILSGQFAQGMKHDFGTGRGGIYQQVAVPANTVVRFSVWGRGYSCHPDPDQDCPNTSTMRPSALRMQIGVDPTGGTQFDAAPVIKSLEANAYDAYQQFVVEADTGDSTLVTVFIMYHPRWPVERNKAYWDQASLTVVGPSSGATGTTVYPTAVPVPTYAWDASVGATPLPTFTPTPTPTPTPQPAANVTPAVPVSSYTVRSGDTLFRIALATGVSMTDLINLNGPTYPSLFSNPDLIYVGWVLRLPGAAAETAETVTPSGETYVVQPGDYLSQIARDKGTTVTTLVALNAATYPSLRDNPDVLYVGWVLRLP